MVTKNGPPESSRKMLSTAPANLLQVITRLHVEQRQSVIKVTSCCSCYSATHPQLVILLPWAVILRSLPPFRLDSIAGAVDGSRGRDPNGSGAGAARTGIGGVLSRVCVLFRPWGVFGTIWISSCYAAASSLSACCTAFATPGMLRFVVLHCF